MNILTDDLPEFVEVDKVKYPILTDFRIWMEFDRVMHSGEVSTKDKVMMIMRLCFDKERCPLFPEDCQKAMNALASFYVCGKAQEAVEEKKKKKERALSFSEDSGYIYSAFLTQYGIDLLSIPYMHWYLFCTLLDGLEETRRIMKIIRWRMCDIESVRDNERKKYLKKMKEIYALPDLRSEREKEKEVAEILSQAF